MKILVTGSNGLIGKEVARNLKERNIEVVEYTRQNGKDILQPTELKKAMKGCAAVIHLAAEINENAGKETLWKTNVQGTKNVMDAAAENKISRVVFTSSVGVYGNQPGIKNEETPLEAETEYEKTKIEAEKIIEGYQELVSYTILRSALVLGPNSYWKQIAKAIKQNKPLPAEGNNTWQMIYYKDLANAILFLLFLDAAENETFVVAGEEKPTLKEVVQKIRAHYGLEGEAKTLSPFMAQLFVLLNGIWCTISGKPNLFSKTHLQRLQHERKYDLTKVHAYGWKGKYSLNAALKETLQTIDNEK